MAYQDFVKSAALVHGQEHGFGDASGKTPDERFRYLKELTFFYLDKEDIETLSRAYAFAYKAHDGQRRKSGEPFIAHPIEVAIILANLHMDVETLIAALLHDTVEDTDVTLEDVTELFGESVAALVAGVTKITQIEVGTLTDEQAATIRKMLVAMNKDIRVIVIKLADRLHNMRTLASLKEDRRIFKSRETLEIYAPIAHRLGINSIKWELEDLSFFYLEPAKYKRVSKMLTESRAERESYLNLIIDILRKEMEKVDIDAQIMGRPKHLFSIYQKMTKKDKSFSELYDLIAVRLIVSTIKDCYSALGAVHTIWHPMPGRFKDYIAMPKFNMYQSLHTTVIGPSGRPLEVQIRTEEMHQKSEFGVAAHWLYKEGASKGKQNANFEKQLAWLRQMVDWSDETEDSKEFLKNLKVDLDESEVYVFTPAGDAKSLRAGSTPVDFAYAIHTEVGNHCVGAKVNGKIAPLTYTLKMGDRVEILTQKSASPSRGWLKIAKTPSARSKIRSYFSKITRSDDLQEGHNILARELKKNDIALSSPQTTKALKKLAIQFGYKEIDDVLVALGGGKESIRHVLNRLKRILGNSGNKQEPAKSLQSSMHTGVMAPMVTNVPQPQRKETRSSTGIVVRGVDDALVRLSKCCNPVLGDDIIGFITRGRGISVHRRDCPNARDLLKEPERIIDVSWENSEEVDTTYRIETYLEALDRMNLLRDVIAVLSEEGVNVVSSSSSTAHDGLVKMRFLFQLSDINHVETILAKLRKVDGVFEARRMLPGEYVGVRK